MAGQGCRRYFGALQGLADTSRNHRAVLSDRNRLLHAVSGSGFQEGCFLYYHDV